MYQRVSNYEAVYGETTLNVSLKRLYSQVKFIIDASDLKYVDNIDVNNIKLSGISNESVLFYIEDGRVVGIYPTCRNHFDNKCECEECFRDFSIEMNKKSDRVYESDYIDELDLKTGISNGHLSFDVEVTGSGGTKTVQKSVPISIKSSTKNTYTIKLKGDAFPPPPNPNCEDPDAKNYGKPGPCEYTWEDEYDGYGNIIGRCRMYRGSRICQLWVSP